MQSDSVLMPNRNIFLSMVHASLVGVGLILFSAAELNLLALVEVVGGIVWVYLPIFGINEAPSVLTVIGGSIVSGAILLDSVGARYKREVIKIY
jgi:DME family drug/metabolite transporter